MALSRVQRKLLNFSPDTDSVNTPDNIIDSNDVYSTLQGVRTLPLLHRVTPPLEEAVNGACMVTFNDGTQYVIAGTATTLNSMTEQLFDPISAAGPWTTQQVNTLGDSSKWRFAQYQDQVIGVDGVNPPVRADQVSLLTATPWTPLGGNPPLSSTIASSDFSLFLVGELGPPLPPQTGPPVTTNRWWSTINPTLWIPDVQTSTVTDTIDQTPGPITAAVALRSTMVLYKARSIFVGSLVGPPLIWSFQEVTRQRGAQSQECVIPVGDTHYVIGADDFFVFDGFSINPLPNELRDWLWLRTGGDFTRFAFGRYDETRSLVFFHYRTVDGPMEWVCFSARTGKWTKGTREVEMSPRSISPGTIESEQYGFTTGLFLDDHALYLYDRTGVGANPGSFVTVGDIGDRSKMYQLSRCRPGFTTRNGAPTMTPLTTYTPGDPFVPQTTVPLSSDGWMNCLVTGRLMELRFDFDDNCELADLTLTLNQVGDL